MDNTVLYHSEHYGKADRTYELWTNGINAVHMLRKDSDVTVFPSLQDLVMYEQGADVESFRTTEARLLDLEDDIESKQLYIYEHLKVEITGKRSEKELPPAPNTPYSTLEMVTSVLQELIQSAGVDSEIYHEAVRMAERTLEKYHGAPEFIPFIEQNVSNTCEMLSCPEYILRSLLHNRLTYVDVTPNAEHLYTLDDGEDDDDSETVKPLIQMIRERAPHAAYFRLTS
jgi:hypothetical protein